MGERTITGQDQVEMEPDPYLSRLDSDFDENGQNKECFLQKSHQLTQGIF